MATGDVFKFTVIAVYLDTSIVNDFHYKDNSGGSTHINTATAAGDYMAYMTPIMAPALPPEWTVYAVRCACVGGPHAGEIGYAYPTSPIIGSVSGNVIPSQLAVTISRNTGHAGKAERGRIFLGPVVDAMFSTLGEGFVDTTNAALQAVAAALIATFTTSTVGLDPVIANKLGAATATKIVNAILQPIVKGRRSRRARVAG